jgi:hypothetical protein
MTDAMPPRGPVSRVSLIQRDIDWIRRAEKATKRKIIQIEKLGSSEDPEKAP